MRNLVLALVLLTALPVLGATPNPADFTVTINVRCNRLRPKHDPFEYQLMGVTIDGKPYEFRTDARLGLLTPGTYKARLMRHRWKPEEDSIDMVYEILLPNKKTLQMELSGMGYDPCGTTD
ncbi:MAG: hypothetical protein JSS87_10300 [Acidobacteria bacterium]|nr:hypothetical protein [Acidobacteriota bacterium]